MDRIQGSFPITDASEVIDGIPDAAEVLVSGFGSVGYPKAVPQALAESGRDHELTVVSGGSLGDEFDRDLVAAGAIARRFPYQSRPASRQAINNGEIAFQDYHVSQMADKVMYGRGFDPDVAVVEAVAVGEGWLIPSSSIGQTPAYVKRSPRLIVEVNTALPTALKQFHDIYQLDTPPNRTPIPLESAGDRIGESVIRFDPEKLDAVVTTCRRDDAYEFREPTKTDLGIASHFGNFLVNEVNDDTLFARKIHLQFGVGSLGNALMSGLDTIDVGEREFVYFGEVIQDGLLEMLTDGDILAASASSLALSREGQDSLFSRLDELSEKIVLRPTTISNHPALINRFGIVAVNTALEVDIYGNVNSTHLHGTQLMNGIGGSGDFMRHALVSVVVLPSTAGEGSISRIRPWVKHVDHTDHDVDVVVTERGVADVRGLSPRERAERIIDRCAHPLHREDLWSYFERGNRRGGHIPHDFEVGL